MYDIIKRPRSGNSPYSCQAFVAHQVSSMSLPEQLKIFRIFVRYIRVLKGGTVWKAKNLKNLHRVKYF